MDRDIPEGVLVVQSGRSPHSVCLAVSLLAVAVYSLSGELPSRSLDEALRTFQMAAFSLLAICGSSVMLAGVYWPRLLPGLLLERVGHVALSMTGVTYIVSLVSVSTFQRSGLVIAVAMAITVGSLWRAARITFRELPAVRACMEAQL